MKILWMVLFVVQLGWGMYLTFIKEDASASLLLATMALLWYVSDKIDEIKKRLDD